MNRTHLSRQTAPAEEKLREKRQRTGKITSSSRPRRDPTESATRKNRLFLQSEVLNTYRNDHDTKRRRPTYPSFAKWHGRLFQPDYSEILSREQTDYMMVVTVLARKPARPDGTAGARLLHRLRGQRAGRLCLRPATGSRAVPSAKNLRVARLSEMQAGAQAVRARGLRCPGIRLRPLHDGVERKPRQSGAGILRAYGHEKGPARTFPSATATT